VARPAAQGNTRRLCLDSPSPEIGRDLRFQKAGKLRVHEREIIGNEVSRKCYNIVASRRHGGGIMRYSTALAKLLIAQLQNLRTRGGATYRLLRLTNLAAGTGKLPVPAPATNLFAREAG